MRCTTKCAIFSSNAILARETLPLSRCIPLGCARFQILRGKIFRQAHLWCIIGIEPACTRERLAGPSPFRGASKLPPKPPWSKGDFALPLNPHRPKCFQRPLETLTDCSDRISWKNVFLQTKFLLICVMMRIKFQAMESLSEFSRLSLLH